MIRATPYIAMEFVEGETLRQKIKSRVGEKESDDVATFRIGTGLENATFRKASINNSKFLF